MAPTSSPSGPTCTCSTPGAFLFVPRGTPHTFRNAGDDLGRIVGTFNPSRFADYFRELAAIIKATGSAPEHERMGGAVQPLRHHVLRVLNATRSARATQATWIANADKTVVARAQ